LREEIKAEQEGEVILMGKEFKNLTPEQLCDLMCGGIEEDGKEFIKKRDKVTRRREEDITSRAGFLKRSKKKHRIDRWQE